VPSSDHALNICSRFDWGTFRLSPVGPVSPVGPDWGTFRLSPVGLSPVGPVPGRSVFRHPRVTIGNEVPLPELPQRTLWRSPTPPKRTCPDHGSFTFPDRSARADALEVSRFSCTLFADVPGIFDYAEPSGHSRSSAAR
jgi:hypothetical protein